MEALEDPDLVLISDDDIENDVVCSDGDPKEAEIVVVSTKRRKNNSRRPSEISHPFFARVKKRASTASRKAKDEELGRHCSGAVEQDSWQSCKWATIHCSGSYLDAEDAVPVFPSRESMDIDLVAGEPGLVPNFLTMLKRDSLRPAQSETTNHTGLENELLVDQVKPTKVSGVIGLSTDTREQLLTWLKEWRVCSPTCTQESRFSDDDDSEAWGDSEDSNLATSPSDPPVALIYGPVGCGKTSLVYAVAANTGRHVYEVDTATYAASARKMVRDLAERTQSRRIGKFDKAGTSTKQILLLEDVDQILENTSEFWDAVSSLNSTSKIPIVLVCNDHRVAERELASRGLNVLSIHVPALSPSDVTTALVQALGKQPIASHLAVIAREARGDLRRALNDAHFWILNSRIAEKGENRVRGAGLREGRLSQVAFASWCLTEISNNGQSLVSCSPEIQDENRIATTLALALDTETLMDSGEKYVYSRASRWSRLYSRLSDTIVLEKRAESDHNFEALALQEFARLEHRTPGAKVVDERSDVERISNRYGHLDIFLSTKESQRDGLAQVELLLPLELSARLQQLYHVSFIALMARDRLEGLSETEPPSRQSRRMQRGAGGGRCSIFDVDKNLLPQIAAMSLKRSCTYEPGRDH